MADEENGSEETSVRGNEWEVVSLTASAYAAAPSAGEEEMAPVDKMTNEDADRSARAVFMSGHFVFLADQHENLPVDLDTCQMHNDTGAEEDNDPVPWPDEENTHAEMELVRGFSEMEVEHEFQSFVENRRFSVESAEGEDDGICSSVKLSSYSFQAERNLITELDEISELNLDSGLHLSDSPSASQEEDTEAASDAWWKRRAISLYTHVKEADAFWSVIVAAALMGLVIIGHRWQQERWQLQQLRLGLGVTDERMNRIQSPLSRLKNVLVGGERRLPTVRGSASSM